LRAFAEHPGVSTDRCAQSRFRRGFRGLEGFTSAQLPNGAGGPLKAETRVRIPSGTPRDTSLAHFWRACTSWFAPTRPYGFDRREDGTLNQRVSAECRQSWRSPRSFRASGLPVPGELPQSASVATPGRTRASSPRRLQVIRERGASTLSSSKTPDPSRPVVLTGGPRRLHRASPRRDASANEVSNRDR
jgi:hypothetical protein